MMKALKTVIALAGLAFAAGLMSSCSPYQEPAGYDNTGMAPAVPSSNYGGSYLSPVK
ncbi:hypothetical protein [Roseibacillus ishigakijimensis]|uniref:Lipoprotein n=1 Tax=Roseibacillus ishigakijimensis TaxID=454146 RepID=A0A934VLD0_9BACT|nr:hypothetical protein [Roseibacillus ishigakijimensis]MBK1832981.1 hypothetical protein [Roseibacillus ishigakijimensis]